MPSQSLGLVMVIVPLTCHALSTNPVSLAIAV
jgi:hypothetical protein